MTKFFVNALKNILNKKNISFILFSVINILFSVKYFSRYTSYYLLLAAVILLFHIFFFYKRTFPKFFYRKSTVINILLLVIFCIVCVFIFNQLPVKSVNVDRWSVITSFWNYYFDGKYVYYAQSHMGSYPGPMPFYYILAFPFYLLGEIGFFSLSGIIIFYLLMKYLKVDSSDQTFFLLLIITSPFYLWEVLARSTLFVNSVLILGSIIFFFKNKDYNSIKNQLILGIVFGLLLSTRNIYALCYIILFLYSLKYKRLDILSTIKIGCFAIIVFSLTFIPFVMGHWEDFLEMNPFIVQSSFLIPFQWTLGIIIFSFFLFCFCKENYDVIFYSGVILFMAIVLHFVYHIINVSVYNSFIESSADLSYFIMCIPFLLCYMLKDKIKTI